MATPRIENPAARDAHNAAMAASGQAPDQQQVASPGGPRAFVPSGFAPGGHRQTPLTLKEQHDIITGGESVLYNGRIISNVVHLPTEAQLAVGDPEKEQLAAFHMQQQIDRLQKDLESLKSGTLAPPPPSRGVGPGVLPAQGTPVQNQPASDTGAVAGHGKAGQESLIEAQRKALLKGQQGEPAP